METRVIVSICRNDKKNVVPLNLCAFVPLNLCAFEPK